MTMSLKMVIDYPDNIPDALQETRVEFERNAKLAMFVKLFEMKKNFIRHGSIYFERGRRTIHVFRTTLSRTGSAGVCFRS